LRGLLRALLLYALVDEKPPDSDPITFSKAARDLIAVSFGCVTAALLHVLQQARLHHNILHSCDLTS